MRSCKVTQYFPSLLLVLQEYLVLRLRKVCELQPRDLAFWRCAELPELMANRVLEPKRRHL